MRATFIAEREHGQSLDELTHREQLRDSAWSSGEELSNQEDKIKQESMMTSGSDRRREHASKDLLPEAVTWPSPALPGPPHGRRAERTRRTRSGSEAVQQPRLQEWVIAR